MSQILGIINDGYTESAVIHAARGLYPRVAFTFRPMLISERVEYFRAAEKAQGLTLRKLVAHYLRAKLVSWDLRDGKGETVPIDEAHLLRLKNGLFERLFAVVSTDQAGDEEPEKADDGDEARDLIEALEKGRPISEIREERQRKNS